MNAKLKWNGDPRAIIDPRLGSDYPVDEYKEVVEIAVQCTKYERNDRPKMQVCINTYLYNYAHNCAYMHIDIHIYIHTYDMHWYTYKCAYTFRKMQTYI